MKFQNLGTDQKIANFLDYSFQETMKLRLLNSMLLQYQRELNQESLDFVLHNDRETWKISDDEYMNLLNYYIEQRTKINRQLQINEKQDLVLEIQKLYSSMQKAKSNILRVHALLGLARSRYNDYYNAR
jgi:hypothetical protein